MGTESTTSLGRRSEKAQSVPPAFIVRTVQALQSGVLNLAEGLAPPFVKILEMAAGFMTAQCIVVVAKLEIADRLTDGPRPVDTLARESGTDPESLYRLMRACASLGVFKETSSRVFELTPSAETLRKDHPKSVRPFVLLVGDAVWRDPWINLSHAMKTGEDSFTHVFGEGFFDHLKEHPEKGNLFDTWMTQVSRMNCPAIAAGYPFGKFRTVVDVGGGHGSLMSHILHRYPGVRGVVFDQPHVVEHVTEISDDVADRCEFVGGDFFKSVPADGDLYIMQQIIHDWSDELAVEILSNCRRAMHDKARLLIVDAVITPGNKRDMNKLIDLQMLVISKGGRERTKREFESIISNADLVLTRVIPTASMFSIVECRPA